jgi:hypothetical protein
MAQAMKVRRPDAVCGGRTKKRLGIFIIELFGGNLDRWGFETSDFGQLFDLQTVLKEQRHRLLEESDRLVFWEHRRPSRPGRNPDLRLGRLVTID